MTVSTVAIVPFGPGKPAPAPLLATLHAGFLPGDRFTALGRLFLERFYYLELPRDGSVVGAVAWAAGRPAGFAAVTADPDGYVPKALARYPGQLTAVLSVTAIRRPGLVPAILRAARAARRPPPRPAGEGTGQLLSIGVLREFRGPRADLEGRTVAHALLAVSVLRLRDQGLGAIRAIVEPGDGRAARFFAREGWTRTAASGGDGPAEEWGLRWRS